MERFLQRTEYAEDQILVSFARLIDDQFFGEKKDILVNDESAEYRAPLVAAMIGSFLESPEVTGRDDGSRVRALVLAEHGETLGELKQLLAEMHIGGAGGGSQEEVQQAAERLRGEPVVAMPASLFLTAAENESFRPRDFGLVIIEGADVFSEQPSEVQRKIWGHLLPPWERRAVLFAEHLGIRTKNTAIDFANSPKTVVLKKAQASLSAIPTSMYRVSSEKKFRVLLSLIQEENRKGHSALLIFCNLRQISREVEARLKLNHIHAEHVSAHGEGGEPFVLVVSNDNLEALPGEFASTAIHYDIPLDADVYLERVRAMQPRNATMIGLVCERYEVGLSAITSRFGIQFELQEPSAEMLECRDASEGVPLELEREHPADEQRPVRRREWQKPEAPHGGSDRRNRGRPEPGRPHSKQGKRGSHEPAPHGGRAPRDHRDEKNSSLYSMSTEERLAYFRNKYRNILKTPIEPTQQYSVAPQPDETPQNSREVNNDSIVKRFIDKFLPGSKGSGQENGEH